VRQAVSSLIEEDIEPLLNLLADNVEFKVVGGGDEPAVVTDYGQQAVADYFTTLGGFVAFWQVDYTAGTRQVIAWGKESFTVDGTDLEGGCEFAMVFELADGMVTRLVMVEDLRVWARPAGEPIEAARWWAGRRPSPPARLPTRRPPTRHG
jgi:ketosteroid isomerase-like protein